MWFIMESTYLWIQLICLHSILVGIKAESVCSRSSFKPRCDSGYLLVIREASYGFMENGTCMTWHDVDNPEGCSNDILNDVSRVCTGSSLCRYPDQPEEYIPDDKMMMGNKNCHGTNTLYNMYLEVSYNCYPASSPTTDCTISRHDVTGTTGVITASAIKNNCGPNKSLKIDAEYGQLIKLELHSYPDPAAPTALQSRVPRQGSSSCVPYGYVTESVSGDNRPICGDAHGKTTITSISSSVHVNITQYTGSDVILLLYTFIGCPVEIGSTAGTQIVHQNSSTAFVRCLFDPESEPWILTCINSSWCGTRRICSPKPEEQHWTWLITVIAAITVVTIVALVTCVIILRYKHRRPDVAVARLNSTDTTFTNDSGVSHNVTTMPPNSTSGVWPTSNPDDEYFDIDDAQSIPGMNVMQNNRRNWEDDSICPAPPRQSYLDRLEVTLGLSGISDTEASMLPLPPPPLAAGKQGEMVSYHYELQAQA